MECFMLTISNELMRFSHYLAGSLLRDAAYSIARRLLFQCTTRFQIIKIWTTLVQEFFW